MPNWSAIEASFVNQTHAQQLGELAACLARLNSWLEKSAIPFLSLSGISK